MYGSFVNERIAEGVEIEYHEGLSMIHGWPRVPFVPEAKTARWKMVRFIGA
jgi:hypothetical protein